MPDIDPAEMVDAPDRIAFLGDVHMNLRWTLEAIAQAARGRAQVIVQLGDFGYTFDQRFLDAVSEELRREHITLIFVDGNHEDHRMLSTGKPGTARLRSIAPRILHAGRGYRWTWNGIRFLALGGAHSVDAGMRQHYGWLWHPEETISTAQVSDAVAGGETDVLISHDCPTGVDIPGLSSDDFPAHEIRRAEAHRRVLRSVVDKVKPVHLWHGHYHVFYSDQVDLGWGPMNVTGLSCDGTSWGENLRVIPLATLQRPGR